MKPFRLATLERLRAQQLEQRAQDLHAADARLAGASAQRERVRARLAEMGRRAAVHSGAELELDNNFRHVLRQQLDDLETSILDLGRAVADARAAWLAARAQLHAVTALRERHAVGVRAERARLEQRELDEYAARWAGAAGR